MSSNRWLPFGILALLYVLHNDWWLWADARIVAGLPVGLVYHALYMVATAAAMFLLVRLAWPHHLEVAGDAGDSPPPADDVGTADGVGDGR